MKLGIESAISHYAISRYTISWRRIAAMIERYWYLLRSSWPRLLELVYFPVVQMLMWGFLQLYLSQNAGFFARAGGTFIGAVLLWDILFRGQLGFSVSFLAIGFFGFNLYGMGLALAAFFLNLILTGWAVGIFVSGVIMRNGLGAENLAWTVMFLLMPLTCVYYPVSVLPHWLQLVAWSLPPTYVFEGMRALVMEHVFRGDLMVEAFALNGLYFAAAVAAFLGLLKSARRAGSLLQTGE